MSYFLPEHYVPESLLRGGQAADAVKELQQRHLALDGLPYKIAQCHFVSIMQAALCYGTHFYHVTQVSPIFLCMNVIYLFASSWTGLLLLFL